jgi:hypothetical protein
MKLLSGLALAGGVVALGAAPPPSFLDGLSAYTANRVGEAETTYAAVAANPGASARERSASARELGRIAWLIDRDAARALARLDEAAAAGDRPCVTGALYIRVLREAEQAERAEAAEARFLPLCPDDPDDGDSVRLQAMQTGLGLAASQAGADRAATLTRVEADLGALSEAGAVALAANRARLGLGLLKGDPAEALAGWRGYFWLTAEEDAPQALSAWRGKVANLFEAGLAAQATPADQAALVELLMRVGFDREARRLATDANLASRAGDNPAWRRAAAYFRFRDTVEAATLELNRGLARGGSRDPSPYETAVKGAMAEAAASLGVQPSLKAMTEQFGLFGTLGLTSNYPSLHAGHVIQDERRAVDQYGRHGDIRYVAIDNMMTNGFESWLWDGRAAAGGWASEEDGINVVVQVRPLYATGPLEAWQLTQDTPARRRFLADQAEHERRDAAVLARQPAAFLPGLRDRLDLQVNAQILARARQIAAGGGEAELRAAFLAEYKRAVDQHSIFIHEGRHTLDHLSGERIDDKLLEYRAKLSELALADYPRLALSAIDADTIGTDTPHGRGNTLIIKAFGEWTAAHASEVAGYDPSQPALLQLDKLSDDQIRLIARSLDPWTRPAPVRR